MKKKLMRDGNVKKSVQLRIAARGRTVSAKKQRLDLDRYDVAILSALATNTRLTTVELANMVHLSRSAVSRRVAALKKLNVFDSSAGIINYRSLGFGVRAIVEVQASSRAAEMLQTQLLERPEVLSVATIAGDGLLHADVIGIDMEHLRIFVRSLQDEADTTTKIVFAREKSPLTLVERMRMLSDASQTDVLHV
jgi:Lrp/AsnC family leucine-responsive transcriptional regulator